VPPLARKNDRSRSLDFDQNQKIVEHIKSGGISRLIYGGNAFLYHVTLAEFESLLEWLGSLYEELWLIPSVGPSFGRALDQAPLLRKYGIKTSMILPCADPRDAAGLEQGFREIAEASGSNLILYIKDESNFGPDKEQGLDVVARLVHDEICTGIKYAVVRDEPQADDYLAALLQRVERRFVISGIGERPAIVHMRDWQLAGFTTGSGCIAPKLSQQLYEACTRRDYETASKLRSRFIPLEDLRDSWGPARVLHHATEVAGIARVGPIPPYVSELGSEQVSILKTAVSELMTDVR